MLCFASLSSASNECLSLVGTYNCYSEEIGRYKFEIRRIKEGLSLISNQSLDEEYRALLNGKKWIKHKDKIKTITNSSCKSSVLTVNYRTDYGEDETETFSYQKYRLDKNGNLLIEDNIPYDDVNFDNGYDTFLDTCIKDIFSES